MSGRTVVLDGKWVGPDIPETMNMVEGTSVSPDSESAKVQENFEKSKLGKLGNVSNDDVDKIIDKYIEEMVDKTLTGF
jgi:hypothetical protein